MAYIWSNNLDSVPLWGRKKPADTNTINLSTLNVSTLNADYISTSKLYSKEGYFDEIINSSIKTSTIILDGQKITADSGAIYLNDNPIAAISSLSTIADWSFFKARSDVNMDNHNINNIANLNANTGTINTLNGNNKITYPNARLLDISANQIRTSSIYTNDMVSEQIYNQFEISTYSIYADLGVIRTINNTTLNNNLINGNRIVLSNDIRSRGVSTINISTNFMEAYETYMNGSVISTLVVQKLGYIDTLVVPKNALISSIYANNISTGNISTNNLYAEMAYTDYLSSRIIRSDIGNIGIGTFRILIGSNIYGYSTINCAGTTNTSTLNAHNISCGQFSVSTINSSNGVFDNLFANNIYNTSNIITSNLTASNDTNLNNLTAGGNLQFNNNLNMNGEILFPFNTVYSIGFPEGIPQYQKDINYLRNLFVENITILGGATGNTIEPPYRNDSILTIGDDIVSPGQVIINGFNPDIFDTGIALQVRGDAQIVQNLGVLGEFNVVGLATLEGDLNVLGAITAQGGVSVTGDVDINGGLQVIGLTNMLGDANVGGVFAVGGETNLAGAVTCEAGIGIAGAVGVTGGNIVFGSGIDTGQTFTTYYTATFNNNIDALDVTMNIANGRILGDSNSHLRIGSISTNNLLASNFKVNDIYTSNIYGNSNLNFFGDIKSLYGDIYFGDAGHTNKNYLNYYNSIFNNTTTFYNDITSLYGDIFFGNASNTGKNYLNYYNSIFNNTTTFSSNITANNVNLYISNTDVRGDDNTKLYSGSISTNTIHTKEIVLSDASDTYIKFLDMSGSLLGIFGTSVTQPDLLALGSASNLYISAQNTMSLQSSNIGLDCSNIVVTGKMYIDQIQSLYNPSLKINCDLDLSNNNLGPVNLLGVSTILTAYTDGNCNSLTSNYIGAGLVFLGKTGDSNFWQLVKPDFNYPLGEVPPLAGSEGIHIVKRSGDDGNMIAMGRLYDDTIYTPWANCTGDLDMSGNNISNVGKMYYGSTRQPFIQYGNVSFVGGATQTITLPVSYIDTNYSIQATYSEDPGASAKPLHYTNKTTSNFDITGVVDHSADWTTFGDAI